MEEFILDLVNFVGHLDFNVVLRMFLLLFAIFWFFIVVWVWFDAADKSTRLSFRFLSVLLVLVFNILGLIIYFLIRPAQSAEERYWQELEKKYLEFETCGLVNCSECGFELEPDFANCPNCGKDIKIVCENCGMHIDKKWGFCAYCGLEREVESSYEEVSFESCAIDRKKSKSRKGLGLKKFFAKKQKPKKEEAVLDGDVCADVDVEVVEDIAKDGKFAKNKSFLLDYLCKLGQKQDECIKRVKFFLKHGDVEELESKEAKETEEGNNQKIEVVESDKEKETKRKDDKKKKGPKKKHKKKKK